MVPRPALRRRAARPSADGPIGERAPSPLGSARPLLLAALVAVVATVVATVVQQPVPPAPPPR